MSEFNSVSAAARAAYDRRMPFSNFGLGKEILRAIQKAGYTRPTQVQAAAIPKVMQGHDLIAIAQTGTGKTAAFVLPMLHRLSLSYRQGQSRVTKALVLAPTRELAVQIMENIRAYGDGLPIRVAAIFGGVVGEGALTPTISAVLRHVLPPATADASGLTLSFLLVTAAFILFADG